MRTEAIVAAAGAGKRLQAGIRKPYCKILGIPIIIYTLQMLSSSNYINNIIIVVNKNDIKRCLGLVKKYRVKKIKVIIEGGKERSDSVYNGLKMLDKDTDIALIHDGVRPFIDKQLIKNSIDCARRFGACVVGVPVKATMKEVTTLPRHHVTGQFVVAKTIDRKNLWEIQTPQVFRKDLVLEAYERFRNMPATDDSMLVEKLGVKVKVIMGSYKNIKITTPEDLVLAKAIAKNRV